jgi:hypothetical protein
VGVDSLDLKDVVQVLDGERLESGPSSAKSPEIAMPIKRRDVHVVGEFSSDGFVIAETKVNRPSAKEKFE